MRILVTGANGYIGRGVIAELKKRNVEIVANDISFDRKEEGIEWIESNLFEMDNPYMEFGKPDVLLHLAWKDGFVHSSRLHIEDIPKHYSFIMKMFESGVNHICCLGSMHEIGYYEGCVNENTQTNPINLYGIGKNTLRQALEISIADRATFQWIRGYYIVGNTDKGSSIFSKLTEAEKRGDNTFPFTSGKSQYDFLDYYVFCEQVVAVLMQSKVNGIINCCSGVPEKLSDRVERFIKDNHYHIQLQYGAFPERPYDSKAIWGDNSKIIEIMKTQSNEY